MQITHFILDKILKRLTYYTPLYLSRCKVISSKKTVWFIGPPCTVHSLLHNEVRKKLCCALRSFKVIQDHWNCYLQTTVHHCNLCLSSIVSEI